MRMRVLTTKLRVEIENEMRVFLESLNFEIEMRVSQKSESNAQTGFGIPNLEIIRSFQFEDLKISDQGMISFQLI